MTTRTQRRTIEFRHAFLLKGIDRILPPGKYDIVSDEELIEGLSFPVYRRVSTIIFVPAAAQASAIEMVSVDPRDLQSAQDLAMPTKACNARTNVARPSSLISPIPQSRNRIRSRPVTGKAKKRRPEPVAITTDMPNFLKAHQPATAAR